MQGVIAIFVKTPGLSPVKTRLAKQLGREEAERFHLDSARAVVQAAQAVCNSANLQCLYAVAEPGAVQHGFWQDLPCLWQGEGGLGERMAHIYQALLDDHDFVLLVGADIPQMTPAQLLDASSWLDREEQARLVFGPSADGGFWLFGGNCSVPQEVWTDVTYSTSDTGIQFLNRIDGLGEIRTLPVLRDIDDMDDLLALQESLQKLTQPLPAQQDLLGFLKSLPAAVS